MRTFLQGISARAESSKKYRFKNLYTMLNKLNLLDSWRYIKKDVASGVDGVSARDYAKNLATNVGSLVERLKRKGYRTKLVRRSYIPKGKGKERPLGILATEDKLLQKAVSRILVAIYEQDFLPYSFGYRPGIGIRESRQALSKELQNGRYNYVVEADIKGYFENINHDWLKKMLSHRIDDEAFLRLIEKWLKAGILESGAKVVHPVTGTPQGGIVSPILANVYLHYVLDLWFEKEVKPSCKGSVYLCRYADDFVVLFQNKIEAEQFYSRLPERLHKFGLSLAKSKSRILSFSKNRISENIRFDFLGLEYRWGYNRKRSPQLKCRTSRKKLHKSIVSVTDWCKKHRNDKVSVIIDKLNSKLRGYFAQYGLIGNFESLQEFYYHVERTLLKWLNRRSDRRSYTWTSYKVMLREFGILHPRITEKRTYQLSLF